MQQVVCGEDGADPVGDSRLGDDLRTPSVMSVT
jgi:hypothetical protein